MRRFAVRIAGLALCASALAGCGMMGGDDDAATPPAGRATDNTPVATDMAAAVRQAQILRTSGDLEGATRILSQLMLGAPDDSRVVGEYGKLLVQQGHTADAVQFLRRAIELQPADWTLYSALGVAYDQLSDQANAKLAYEHALALKPGEPAVLNNFAMSRMLAGDRVAARTLMMQAQASGSTDPRIAKNLALLDSTMPAPVTAVAAAAPATPPAHPEATAMASRPPIVGSNSVVPVAMPATTPAHPAATALSSRTPVVVASNPIAALATPAHGAPLPIAHNGVQVVMQEVPIDPLAGPVGHRPAKPAKLAKADKPAKAKPATRRALAATAPAKPATPRVLAANAPAKPAKPAKPQATDHIPALRMTADASKP